MKRKYLIECKDKNFYSSKLLFWVKADTKPEAISKASQLAQRAKTELAEILINDKENEYNEYYMQSLRDASMDCDGYIAYSVTDVKRKFGKTSLDWHENNCRLWI